MDRVLNSTILRGTPRRVAFLRFVVEESLSGRPERLKGYTIAIEALGRKDNFDPQTNPLVRVEAGRLRTALQNYYAGPGADDPIEIALPRGSYIPTFSRRRPPSRLPRFIAQLSAMRPLGIRPLPSFAICVLIFSAGAGAGAFANRSMSACISMLQNLASPIQPR